MVLALDVRDAGAVDAKHGQPPAAHASDLDLAQLAATHEAQGTQEKVLGLDHRFLPRSHARWIGGGDPAKVGPISGESVSPLISGRRRGPCQE